MIMEVLMGIFLKACVAVLVGVVCLAGLLLYSKKKDKEEAQNGNRADCPEKENAGAGHLTCNGDCSHCSSHH